MRALPAPGPDVPVDQRRPFLDRAGRHVDELVSVSVVGPPVDAFEAHRLREADPAGRCRRHEPEQVHEEDPRLVDLFTDDPLDLPGEDGRNRPPAVVGQREGADRRPVVELDVDAGWWRLLLALPLQLRDRVQESGVVPRIVATQRVLARKRDEMNASIPGENYRSCRQKYAITLPSAELSRARGGPRCMTLPLSRETVKW